MAHLLVLDLDALVPADVRSKGIAQAIEDEAIARVKPTHILRVHLRPWEGLARTLQRTEPVTIVTGSGNVDWWRVALNDVRTLLTLPDSETLDGSDAWELEYWALRTFGVPAQKARDVLAKGWKVSERNQHYRQVQDAKKALSDFDFDVNGTEYEEPEALPQSRIEVRESPGRYTTITTRQGFLDAIDRCHGRVVAWDTETTGKNARKDTIVGFSFTGHEGEGYYVPLAHQGGENLPLGVFVETVPLLFHVAAGTVAQNAKFDLQVLWRLGLDVPTGVEDTMVQAWLLNEPKVGLKALTKCILGIDQTTIDTLIGSGKHAITMDQVPVDKATHYAAQDADMTLRLHNILRGRLVERQMDHLYSSVELPLIPILAEMEMEGMPVDRSLVEERERELEQEMEHYRRQVESMVGEIQLSSDDQVRTLLFDRLGLPPQKITPGGKYSVDEDTLLALRGMHPVLEPILAWNEREKELTAFIRPYLNKHIDAGRIYTSLNQASTPSEKNAPVTGRLSSSNPNLQQVPPKVRRAFVAPDGWQWLSCDYSQLEMRILAYMSLDPTLLLSLLEGGDLHAKTMEIVLGVDPTRLKAEDPNRYNSTRTIAKNVGFGIAYGAQEDKIAKQVRKAGAAVSAEQVETFFARHKEEYPRLWRWREEAIQSAREHGYAKTLLGRRRYLPQITSGDPKERSAAEREAVNFCIQGSAADLVKAAQVRTYGVGKRLGLRMVLQIHDEILWLAPEEKLQEACKVIPGAMVEPNLIDPVPLLTEAKTGKHWGAVK